MTAQSKKPTTTGRAYPFRTGWAIFLLAVNFLVAAIYFHILNI